LSGFGIPGIDSESDGGSSEGHEEGEGKRADAGANIHLIGLAGDRADVDAHLSGGGAGTKDSQGDSSGHTGENIKELVQRALAGESDPLALADELLGVSEFDTDDDSDSTDSDSDARLHADTKGISHGPPAIPDQLRRVLERWPRVVKPASHVLQDGHASVVEHAILLCSLLRSLGEDAYVCAGLALPLGGFGSTNQGDAGTGAVGGSSSASGGASQQQGTMREQSPEDKAITGWMSLAGIQAPTATGKAVARAVPLSKQQAKQGPSLRTYLSDMSQSVVSDEEGGGEATQIMPPSLSDMRLSATLQAIDEAQPDADTIARPKEGAQEELHFWVVVFPRRDDEER